MGKMNHSTYQLNAYTSDWGWGWGGGVVHAAAAARRTLGAFVYILREGRGGPLDPLTTGEP